MTTTKSSSGIIMRDTAGNGNGGYGNDEDGGYVLHKDDPDEHDDEDHDEECNISKSNNSHKKTAKNNKVPILFVSCGGGCGVSGSRSLGNAATISDLDDIDESGP